MDETMGFYNVISLRKYLLSRANFFQTEFEIM